MITRIRREGESIRALLHDHYPTPGTWTETAYWLAVGLHTRARHLLHPLTDEERAANEAELVSGVHVDPTPAPAEDKKDGEE